MKVAVALGIVLFGCRALEEAPARGDGAEVVVGVVWPEKGDLFWEGIAQAEEEIAAAGGILGRPLRLRRMLDGGSITDAKQKAQELADDLEVVAVIGHRDPEAARVVSVLYEYTDLLMLAPASTSAQLTRTGFRRIFRMLPTDDQIGAGLAEHAAETGRRQVLVIHSNDAGARALVNAFESRGDTLGLHVIDRIGFDRGAAKVSLSGTDAARVEAVLLATGSAGDAEDALAALGAAGIRAPVLAPIQLSGMAGRGGGGMIVASVFDPAAENEFSSAFRAKHGKPPDVWAAQGYAALRLLADAMGRAKSTAPGKVADALREERFDADGGVKSMRLVFGGE